MDGLHVRVLHRLIGVYLLLLSGSAARVQDDTHQYRIRKEEQIMYGGRYSNATGNGVRRQGIDTSLAKYTVERLLSMRSRTGLIYNVSLPPSLDGITCQVMRLRTGSLRRRGFSFNNFHIPKGMLVHTGGPFVFLIYKSIPLNSTSLLYALPPGYTFISPIVGIFIYTSITSTSFNESSSEMNLLCPPLTNPPISIAIPIDRPYMHSIIPLCAFFDINGTFSFTNLSSPPNTCSSFSLMDSALVLPPHTSLSPSPSSSPSITSSTKASKYEPSRPWKVALIAVLASLFGFAIMGAAVVVGMRVQDKCEAAKMLKETDHNQETLHTSVIGHTRAPTAAGVRTKPTLETESLRHPPRPPTFLS